MGIDVPQRSFLFPLPLVISAAYVYMYSRWLISLNTLSPTSKLEGSGAPAVGLSTSRRVQICDREMPARTDTIRICGAEWRLAAKVPLNFLVSFRNSTTCELQAGSVRCLYQESALAHIEHQAGLIGGSARAKTSSI